MFDIGWTELLLIGIVALIVVGPKDLPGMFRAVGQFTGKMKGMARDFQRAMNEAADDAGVGDVAKDLRKMNSAKNMGLDGVADTLKDATNFTSSNSPKAMGSETARLTQERAEQARKIREAAEAKAKARKAAEATAKADVAKTADAKPKTTKAKSTPAKKTASKKAAPKKAASKTTAKVPAAKKAAPTKTAAKKPAAKKTTAKKAAPAKGAKKSSSS